MYAHVNMLHREINNASSPSEFDCQSIVEKKKGKGKIKNWKLKLMKYEKKEKKK